MTDARGPAAAWRVAVVGAGLMGGWHADAVARAGFRVAAVCDPDERRAAALAARHPGALVFTDPGAALTREVADAVHLCTPLPTHAPLAARAMDAGLHTLVEKPLAVGAAATGELLAHAARQGVLLCPVHQYVFQPGALAAPAALAAIGRLLHVDATACSAGAEGGDDAHRDAIAASVLPHALSLLARLAPAVLAGATWRVLRPRAGELRADGVGDGVTVSLMVSMAGRPTTNTLRLIGERGTVHLDLFHGFAVRERGEVSRRRKIVHPFLLAGGTLAAAAANLAGRAARREPAYPGLRELVRRFHEAARDGGPAPIPPEETMQVARAWDAILDTPAPSVRQAGAAAVTR